ncbi:Ornithine decarboxylase [Salix suchowensis]|nr:Ornithine decarboxylase [Salix suchowensis]
MSPVEILPAFSPVDFTFSTDSFGEQKYSCKGNDAVNDILPPSTYFKHDDSGSSEDDPKVLFPDLPPLFTGHPDVHLRNGVMKAQQMSVDHVPDAERAFFVADLGQIYRQHQRWVKCLPDIQPFYAIKCNPDPYVLRLLAALGAGFDCASNGEISQVLSLGGIDPSRIIFANPCKATSFIRNAGKVGVDLMTFDNMDELYKISRAHPGAKLVVRILADDSKSLCAFNIKFGAALEVVPSLLAKARDLRLDVVGVSFHVGSGCYDPSVYTDAIMRARAVFDMAQQVGFELNLLDVATFLSDAIHQYFPDRHGIRVIAEPGRFYVSKAFSLAANIIAHYINDGVYGAFNCILFDHQVVHPYVLSLNGSFHVPSSEPLQTSSVWGPTCDSIDCVCPSTKLPGALQVGDWLGFHNMGAYTICAASQFNGFEVSNVIYTTGSVGVSKEEHVRRPRKSVYLTKNIKFITAWSAREFSPDFRYRLLRRAEDWPVRQMSTFGA